MRDKKNSKNILRMGLAIGMMMNIKKNDDN
jgi:hypothetical protein